MTIGERLLNLTAEYNNSVESREHSHLGGNPIGREPKVIAADYETVLRELLS